jgi:putative transposase
MCLGKPISKKEAITRSLRIEYPGAFYHVMSRGNEQKDVFQSQKDWEKFLSYVESAGVRYGVVVHPWCLMRHHDHLLLETPSGNLAQVMRHMNGAYTTYVNVKRKRLGAIECRRTFFLNTIQKRVSKVT